MPSILIVTVTLHCFVSYTGLQTQPDNGVKIVDVNGGMLEMSWERHAVTLANADDSALSAAAAAVAADTGVDLAAFPAPTSVHSSDAAPFSTAPLVFVGHDNRTSCPTLLAALLKGVQAAGGTAVSYGTSTLK